MADRTGERIGEAWTLLSPLGQSSSSIVYLARHDSGALHALKIMLEPKGPNPAKRERFLREAEAVSALDHPALVPVFANGKDANGVPFFVMEFLEGAPIDSLPLPLTLGRLLDLTSALLDCLSAVHGAGIVHRDLKPQNLLVEEDGSLRVLDFGVAKSPSAPPTNPGTILGTASYMAPEQARGLPATPQVDLYSVGAILFRLITGRPVHVGKTVWEVAYLVGSSPAPELGRLAPELPEAVTRFVMRALAFDPNRRFPSAAVMAETLARVRGDLTKEELARPIAPAERDQGLLTDSTEVVSRRANDPKLAPRVGARPDRPPTR